MKTFKAPFFFLFLISGLFTFETLAGVPAQPSYLQPDVIQNTISKHWELARTRRRVGLEIEAFTDRNLDEVAFLLAQSFGGTFDKHTLYFVNPGPATFHEFVELVCPSPNPLQFVHFMVKRPIQWELKGGNTFTNRLNSFGVEARLRDNGEWTPLFEFTFATENALVAAFKEQCKLHHKADNSPIYINKSGVHFPPEFTSPPQPLTFFNFEKQRAFDTSPIPKPLELFEHTPLVFDYVSGPESLIPMRVGSFANRTSGNLMDRLQGAIESRSPFYLKPFANLLSMDIRSSPLGDLNISFDGANLEIVTPPLFPSSQWEEAVAHLLQVLAQHGFQGMENTQKDTHASLQVNVEILKDELTNLSFLGNLLQTWAENRTTIFEFFKPSPLRHEYFSPPQLGEIEALLKILAPPITHSRSQETRNILDKYTDVNISHAVKRALQETQMGMGQSPFIKLARPALEYRIFDTNLTPKGIANSLLAIQFATAFTEWFGTSTPFQDETQPL